MPVTRRRPRARFATIVMKNDNKHSNPVNEDNTNGNENQNENDVNIFQGKSSRKRSRRSSRDTDYARRGLEMSWRFQNRKGDAPSTCKACNGRGTVECSWCHATGVLMLGDRLVCSIEGQSHCLVCDNGEVPCKTCKGTGKLASWMIGGK